MNREDAAFLDSSHNFISSAQVPNHRCVWPSTCCRDDTRHVFGFQVCIFTPGTYFLTVRSNFFCFIVNSGDKYWWPLLARLLHHALDSQKPVLLLNVGPTRADTIPDVQKVDFPSGSVLCQAAKLVLYVLFIKLVLSFLNPEFPSIYNFPRTSTWSIAISMTDKLVENKLAEIKSFVKCYRATPMSRKKRLNRRNYTSRAVFTVIDYCYWLSIKIRYHLNYAIRWLTRTSYGEY